MGVRYFCDRCEKEFKSGGLKMPVYTRDTFGVKSFYMGDGYLCEKCARKFHKVKHRLKYEEEFFTMKDEDLIPESDCLIINFDNAPMDIACLTISRNNKDNIEVINSFYGEEALEEYKELIGMV